MEFPILSSLTGDIDRLLGAHESRRPEHFPNKDRERFEGLFPISVAEQLFAKSLVNSAFVGVVRAGSQFHPQQFSCSFPIGIGGPSHDFIDPSKIAKAFSDGATVLIRGVQTFWPPVKQFAQDLEDEINHPLAINCYITPPNSMGLSRHYDMHEVLILQVEGSKKWEIGPRGFLDPLEGRHPFVPGTPVSEEMTVDMEAGDVLYVPRGYLHRCASDSKLSLHLTVGILTRSRYDVLKSFVETTTEEPKFRVGLPWGFLREDGRGYQSVNVTVDMFNDWTPENIETVLNHERELMKTVRRLPDAKVFQSS